MSTHKDRLGTSYTSYTKPLTNFNSRLLIVYILCAECFGMIRQLIHSRS